MNSPNVHVYLNIWSLKNSQILGHVMTLGTIIWLIIINILVQNWNLAQGESLLKIFTTHPFVLDFNTQTRLWCNWGLVCEHRQGSSYYCMLGFQTVDSSKLLQAVYAENELFLTVLRWMENGPFLPLASSAEIGGCLEGTSGPHHTSLLCRSWLQ